MRRVVALVAILIAASPSLARAAWEFRDYVTPLGDKGTGIFEPDSEGEGATFFFGCRALNSPSSASIRVSHSSST